MTHLLTRRRAGTGRRWRESVVLPSVIAVCALAASVLIATGGNLLPAGSTAAPPPAPAPVAHSVRYEVTGPPGATASISYVAASNGAMTKVLNQPLPWSTNAGVSRGAAPFAQLTVVTVASGPSSPAVTSCAITVDGRRVAENHTTSAGTAMVDCDAVVR